MPSLPWAGKVRRGFAGYVADKCRVQRKVVAEVLAGREKSARLEAYICGALGLEIPEYPRKEKAPPLPTTRRVTRPKKTTHSLGANDAAADVSPAKPGPDDPARA